MLDHILSEADQPTFRVLPPIHAHLVDGIEQGHPPNALTCRGSCAFVPDERPLAWRSSVSTVTSRFGRAVFGVALAAVLLAGVAACTPSGPTPRPHGHRYVSFYISAWKWLNTHPVTTLRVCVREDCRTLSGSHYWWKLADPSLAQGAAVTVTIFKPGAPVRRRSIRVPAVPTTPRSLLPECAHTKTFSGDVLVGAFGGLIEGHGPNNGCFLRPKPRGPLTG